MECSNIFRELCKTDQIMAVYLAIIYMLCFSTHGDLNPKRMQSWNCMRHMIMTKIRSEFLAWFGYTDMKKSIPIALCTVHTHKHPSKPRYLPIRSSVFYYYSVNQRHKRTVLSSSFFQLLLLLFVALDHVLFAIDHKTKRP